LGFDLVIADGDNSAHAAIDVGIALRAVIVITAVCREVTVEFIEVGDGRAIGFGEAVNGEAIEGVGDGFVDADKFGKMQWGGVIVIIVGAAA
jgi:hypothetical protein